MTGLGVIQIDSCSSFEDSTYLEALDSFFFLIDTSVQFQCDTFSLVCKRKVAQDSLEVAKPNSKSLEKECKKTMPKYTVLHLFVIPDRSFCVGACFILILAAAWLLQAAETQLTQSKYNGDNKVSLN